jgi:hypothetical protein
MNGTGPENKGPRTGRGLGRCREVIERDTAEKLGIDIGLRRNAGRGAKIKASN